MVQSFKTKQIDILSHIKPYTTDLVINHNAIKLTDNTAVWGLGTPNCTLNAMNSFVKKNPKTIQAYLRAVKKSFELARDNPDYVVELLQK
jgi:ABC-type nitrate/sulfonate/bicarbonate transport system substrate-binding protein